MEGWRPGRTGLMLWFLGLRNACDGVADGPDWAMTKTNCVKAEAK